MPTTTRTSYLCTGVSAGEGKWMCEGSSFWLLQTDSHKPTHNTQCCPVSAGLQGPAAFFIVHSEHQAAQCSQTFTGAKLWKYSSGLSLKGSTFYCNAIYVCANIWSIYSGVNICTVSCILNRMLVSISNLHNHYQMWSLWRFSDAQKQLFPVWAVLWQEDFTVFWVRGKKNKESQGNASNLKQC